MTRLLRDERGAVAILAAIGLMVMLGFTALAVDVGTATLAKRRLQGVADEGALAAAASDPAGRVQAVRRVLQANGMQDATLRLVEGGWHPDPTLSPDARFSPGPESDAVRVILERRIGTPFRAILTGRSATTVGATATAARIDYASFSLGSRLADVGGGVPGAVLNGLAGTDLGLGVMDYRSLADARLDLLAFSDALRTRLNLTGASYERVLDSDIRLPVLAQAMADATPAAAALLRGVSARLPATPIQVGSLVNLGPLSASDGAGASNKLSVDPLSVLREALVAAGGARQVSLNLGASLPGLASVRATLAVGQRPAASPWLTVAKDGGVTVRTAQQRLLLETDIGVPGLATVSLPLFTELASAQARLASISCDGPDKKVSLDVMPSPGSVAVAGVDRSSLADMGRDPVTGPAILVGTPLLRVTGSARVAAGADTGWQRVEFVGAETDGGTVRTVGSTSIVQGVVASMLRTIDLRVEALGLGLGLGGVTQTVGAALQGVAPALDLLLTQIQDTLGIHLGRADVSMNGTRCGRSSLVG